MRKAIIILIVILIATYSSVSAQVPILSGEGSILMDYDCKEILFEKDAHKQFYPASTTKIMTAILALEHGNLNDIVTIDEEVISQTAGSHIALDYDEEVSFEDLLNAMLIESANDAALALGKHISGSVEEFVKLMNDKAKEIGALNTNYVNPNGLHNENHVSTPYDLALIGSYAMENETFREIVIKPTYEIGPTNKKSETRYLRSTNKFFNGNESIDLDGKTIPIRYEGVLGVKTGYTGHAQNCLVTYAEKDGQRLIAVVLKSDGKEVYTDTHKLLNYGFTNFQNFMLGNPNEFIDNIEIPNGTIPLVAGVLDDGLSYTLNIKDYENINRKVILGEDLQAPISKGDILGTVEYYSNEKLLGETNIVSTMDIEIDPYTKLSYRLMSNWYIILIVLFFILRIIIIMNNKRRRKMRRKTRMYG